MIYRCEICGKEFDALWPDLYRYKRGGTFLCSWSCLRKYDAMNGSGDMTLTDKQKRMACEMALEGKNPLQYLKEIGVKNPTVAWDTCLNWAKKNNMADFEKLPKRFGQQKKEAPKVELVYDESIAEEYRREQEEKKAEQAEKVKDEELAREEAMRDMVIPEEDFWTFTAMSNAELGEFYYDRKYKTIDWRHPDGEEISLPPEQWAKLARKIPVILRTLGVEV